MCDLLSGFIKKKIFYVSFQGQPNRLLIYAFVNIVSIM